MLLDNLFSILMIGIASNLDNAGVGISYGIRDIYVPWYSNFLIALMSTITTLFSGIIGKWLSLWVSPRIGTWIGTLLLVLVGVWVLLQPVIDHLPKYTSKSKSKSKNTLLRILQRPEEADLDHSKTISILESILLGLALAINALAGGFDAGLTKLNIELTAISVGIFSYVLFGFSIYIGKNYISGALGKKATYFAGILLILIGIHQLF